jgi:CYTH domain-containing protein
MALEIERKFLIKNIPFDITKFPHREIMQGYFLNSENKEIRLRKKGSNYFKTRKSGS